MTKTTRTKVSKSNKTIKAIITATFPDWKGRKVTVIEAAPDWQHTQYIDDQTSVRVVHLDDMSVHSGDRPSMSCPVVYHAAHEDAAVVMLSRFMGQDMGIEIIIPGGDLHRSAIDSVAVSVAMDALLEGDKRRATAVLTPCGNVAGIAMALVEARVKELQKGEQDAERSARLERDRMDPTSVINTQYIQRVAARS